MVGINRPIDRGRDFSVTARKDSFFFSFEYLTQRIRLDRPILSGQRRGSYGPPLIYGGLRLPTRKP